MVILRTLFIRVMDFSIAASFLMLAVMLLRPFLKRVPKWILCLLWGMVAFRLVCPVQLESPISLLPRWADHLIAEGEIQGEMQNTQEKMQNPQAETQNVQGKVQNRQEETQNLQGELQVTQGETSDASGELQSSQGKTQGIQGEKMDMPGESVNAQTEKTATYAARPIGTALGEDYLAGSGEDAFGTDYLSVSGEGGFGAEEFTEENLERSDGVKARKEKQKFAIRALEVGSCIWMLGMLAMLGYAGICMWRIKKKLQLPGLEKRTEEGIVYYEGDGIGAPFVLGIFVPKIYLPAGTDPKQRKHILCHECAHVRRMDSLWKLAGFMILSVYWFHPLCWAAYALFCRDMEQACDERATREMDWEARAEYCQVLLNMCVKERGKLVSPVAFGETGARERIKAVLSYRKPSKWIIAVSLLLCFALGGCFMTTPRAQLDNAESSDMESKESGVGDEIEVTNDKVQKDDTENKVTNGKDRKDDVENKVTNGKDRKDDVENGVDRDNIKDSDKEGQADTDGEVAPEPSELPIYVCADADLPVMISVGKSGAGQVTLKTDIKKHYEELAKNADWAEYAAERLYFANHAKGLEIGRAVKNPDRKAEPTGWEVKPSYRAYYTILGEDDRDVLGELTVHYWRDDRNQIQVVDASFEENRDGFMAGNQGEKSGKVLREIPVKMGDGVTGKILIYGVANLYGGDTYGITRIELCSTGGETVSKLLMRDANLCFGLSDSIYLTSSEYDGGIILQDVTFDGYQDLGLRTKLPDGTPCVVYWEYNVWLRAFDPLGCYREKLWVDTENKVCMVDYKEREVFVKETYLPDGYLGLYLEKRARTTYVNDQAKVEVENTCLAIDNPVYEKLLLNLLENRVLPFTNGYYQVEEDPRANYYCVADIDGDGREELLLWFRNTLSTSTELFCIYDMDEKTGTARLEFWEHPDICFINWWREETQELSHYIKAKLSHNQGRSDVDGFWPYTVYQYVTAKDQYEVFCEVDAWEKTLYGQGFPDGADLDGNGVVYCLTKGDVVTYLDDAAYQEWVSENGFDAVTKYGGNFSRIHWNMIR